jgi:hypothetical protein
MLTGTSVFVPSGRDWRSPINLKRRLHMTASNNNQTASKSPSHIVYQVRDREGQKGFFTRIGAAWPHKNGQGFNVQIDSVPLDGRIVLCIATDKKG